MKVLHCRDIGERTCNFEAEGATKEEVERKLLDHAAQKHWWDLESLDQDERLHLFEQMDAMIEEKRAK